MNIKNIAFASIAIYFYWGTLIFWLCYGIHKNNSIAEPELGITTDMNRFLKTDENNQCYPHPFLQCSSSLPSARQGCTRAHGVGVTSPSASQHLSYHTQQTPTQPWPWDFWGKMPQYKAQQLKLQQRANKCTLKEMEKWLINHLRDQGALLEAFAVHKTTKMS